MEDGVKFIFKTLLRVPIIIYISFAILNAFAFCFAYFKMLGVSYVVQQAALEDNYLTNDNCESIGNYIRNLDKSSVFIDEANIIVGVQEPGTGSGASYTQPTYQLAFDYVANTQDVRLTSAAGNTTYASAIAAANPEPATKDYAGNWNARRKHQYGTLVTVGVTYKFNTIWPFDYRKLTYSGNNTGLLRTSATDDGVRLGGYTEKNMLENMASRQARGKVADTTATYESMKLSTNRINIAYTIPGMKYYPDMGKTGT